MPRERAFGSGLDPDPPARIGFQTKGRRSGFRKGASNRRTASKANPRSPGGKRGGAIRRLVEGEIGAPVTGMESGPLRCSCAARIAWGFPGIPPVTIPPPGPGDRNRPKSLGRRDVPLPHGQRKGPGSRVPGMPRRRSARSSEDPATSLGPPRSNRRRVAPAEFGRVRGPGAVGKGAGSDDPVRARGTPLPALFASKSRSDRHFRKNECIILHGCCSANAEPSPEPTP